MISDVISRKTHRQDVEDIVFRYKGETRIGRVFNFSGNLSDIDNLLKLQRRISTENVIFPDLRHEIDETRVCLSVSTDRVSPFTGKPRGFDELFQPIDELHSQGFLHMGISIDSFMLQEDRCVLMAWGDALFHSSNTLSPELENGGFSSPASDYFMLGTMLSSENCRIWDGSGAPDLKKLRHRSPRKRMESIGRTSSFSKVDIPPLQTFTFVRGGEWRIRDGLLNEMLCAASIKGWQTGVVKCRFQESHRPLPGSDTCSALIDSPKALVENVFPLDEGVPKLLAVDQIDYASEDLKAILRQLSEMITPDIAVVVSSVTDPWEIDNRTESSIQLEDPPTGASNLDPWELPLLDTVAGHPIQSGYSFQFRTDHTLDLKRKIMNCKDLHSEGAYRYLISEVGMELIDADNKKLLTDCYIKLGLHDLALDTIPEEDCFLKGVVFAKKAEYARALKYFERAVELGMNPIEMGRPYFSSLVETGDREKAKHFLMKSSDPESIEYLCWILDCEGKPNEALAILEDTLSRTVSDARVPLLSLKAVLNMRIGKTDQALIAATEANMLAADSLDPEQQQICLISRGRMLEVMGFWHDALNSYRQATSLARKTFSPGYLSRLIHKYVLEFRMGNLKLAANTMREIESLKMSGESLLYRQRILQIKAYSGAMLRKGESAIPEVNRALALTAELKRPLMQGLCQLYKGQLLLQSGNTREAQRIIEQARLTGIELGDKHLILLCDLAISYLQIPSDAEGILSRARALNLKLEELEAMVILNRSRDETFEKILDLPAPLKAFELATCFGLPADTRIRNRLLKTYEYISEMLELEDLRLFRKAHPEINDLLDHNKTVPPELGTFRNQVENIAKWIPAFTSGHENVSDLSTRFGLDWSDEPIPEAVNEVRIALPDGNRVYFSGGDTSVIRLFEPVINSVLNVCHPEARSRKEEDIHFPEIIGKSEVIKQVLNLIRKITDSRVPVLVTGDTGTGKELIARAIYRTSGCSGAFVAVDCGAIPENLIESELFGSVKGAFTDSRADRKGLIESANGGVLFLDEIGNMPLHLQAKLLRVLETGMMRRIGDSLERKVDFRLISATNSDLSSRIKQRRFRSDLYYRIGVMVIEVPPLRERQEDIPLLVRHFSSELNSGKNPPPTFLKSAVRKLCAYDWPGNVRELRNVVQRSMLLSNGRIIRESDVYLENSSSEEHHSGGYPVEKSLESVITEHVHSTYMKHKSKKKTAEILKCDPKTLNKYLKLYDRNKGV
jgi:two-component system, NtrC family, response regulator